MKMIIILPLIQNMYFLREDISWRYGLYNISAASWEDDDGIEDIWATCSSFLGDTSPM